MNRAGLVRAWPIAVASLLSFWLALGLAGDFAWVVVLLVLVLLIVGFVRVARNFSGTAKDQAGSNGIGVK